MKAVRSWVASQKSTEEQMDVQNNEPSSEEKSDNKQRHDSGYHEQAGEHEQFG